MGFLGGYLHSTPLLLHLWQRGVCFPHLRFALAHALHAPDGTLSVIFVYVFTSLLCSERRAFVSVSPRWIADFARLDANSCGRYPNLTSVRRLVSESGRHLRTHTLHEWADSISAPKLVLLIRKIPPSGRNPYC